MRIRTTPINSFVNGQTYLKTLSEIRETRHGSYSDVLHYRHFPVSGYLFSGPSGGITSVSNWVHSYDYLRIVLDISLRRSGYALRTIDWRKLPTSTSFNSLIFLNELQETVGMFGLRALRSALKDPFGIYGWYEFGFGPFLSELSAILSGIDIAIRSLKDESFPFSTHYSVNFRYVNEDGPVYSYPVDPVLSSEGTYLCRFTGTIRPDISGLGSLDLIGFHPDLLTIWEAAPLSFLVDYFLPIGDFLDNFCRGGWVSSARFTGFLSEKFTISGLTGSRGYTHVTLPSMKAYTRTILKDQSVSVQSLPRPVEFEFPNFRQLFNTLYLGARMLPGRRK
jgi:hypothetical protein